MRTNLAQSPSIRRREPGGLALYGPGLLGRPLTAACGVGPYPPARTHTGASYDEAFSGSGAVAVAVGGAMTAGADEELVLTAPVDGSYAFVVSNDNAQPSTFTFAADVTTAPGIFSDGFESGDTSGWSATMKN